MSRRRSRVHALEMLYEREMTGRGLGDIMEKFWDEAPNREAAEDERLYAQRLFTAAAERAPDWDAAIAGASKNWSLERIAVMDRQIMRLALAERSLAEAPPRVILDEAVEMAKKYGDTRSAEFVNGVLDRIFGLGVGEGSGGDAS